MNTFVATPPSSATTEDKPSVMNAVYPIDLSLSKKRSILLKIIPLVYKCGGTAHLTQVYIDKISRILEVEALVTFIPGRVLITWPSTSTPVLEEGNNDTTASVSLIDIPIALQCRWSFRLAALQKLDNLISEMNSTPYETFMKRINEIEKDPPLYDALILLLAFGFMAAPMAPAFFGGSLLDGLVTLAIGLVAGAFALLSDYSPLVLPLHELACAFTCALLCIFFASISAGSSQPISFWPCVLASTIWILPGFSMVIGTIDIASKASAVNGFIMVSSGFFVALVMGFSYSAAIWVTKIDPNPLLRQSTLPELQVDLGTASLLCAIFAIACCFIYQARLGQIPIPIIMTLFCFLSCVVLQLILPDELVHLIAAFLLGLVLRTTAYVSKQIPETALYTAMLPLVPGSRIVRACFALFTRLNGVDCSGDNAHFFKTIFGSFSICAIVAFGLLTSELLFTRAIGLTRRFSKKSLIL